jgi:hypothetical protein
MHKRTESDSRNFTHGDYTHSYANREPKFVKQRPESSKQIIFNSQNIDSKSLIVENTRLKQEIRTLESESRSPVNNPSMFLTREENLDMQIAFR